MNPEFTPKEPRMRVCARCAKPIVEPRRRTYCSEACADVVAHAKRLERLGKGQMKLSKWHITPRKEG